MDIEEFTKDEYLKFINKYTDLENKIDCDTFSIIFMRGMKSYNLFMES